MAVCRWLTTQAGVAAIPPTHCTRAAHQPLVANLARFCFCKTDEMLDEAALRLARSGVEANGASLTPYRQSSNAGPVAL